MRRALPASGMPTSRPRPLFERYYDACLGYVPAMWPGHVVGFWPEGERPARAGDPSYGWGSLGTRVDTFRRHGHHHDLVRRHIQPVAPTLERPRAAARRWPGG